MGFPPIFFFFKHIHPPTSELCCAPTFLRGNQIFLPSFCFYLQLTDRGCVWELPCVPAEKPEEPFRDGLPGRHGPGRWPRRARLTLAPWRILWGLAEPRSLVACGEFLASSWLRGTVPTHGLVFGKDSYKKGVLAKDPVTCLDHLCLRLSDRVECLENSLY